MEISEFEECLLRWDFLGKGLDHEKNLIYGRDCSLLELRWLHAVFAVCTPQEVEVCVHSNPQLEFFPYLDELTRYNGACLFGGDLFLFGLHPPSGVFSSGRMPWDLITHTIDSWPVVRRFGGVLIGGKIVEEELFHFVQMRDGCIVTANEVGEVIESHEPGFDSFLRREILTCQNLPKWRKHFKV